MLITNLFLIVNDVALHQDKIPESCLLLILQNQDSEAVIIENVLAQAEKAVPSVVAVIFEGFPTYFSNYVAI